MTFVMRCIKRSANAKDGYQGLCAWMEKVAQKCHGNFKIKLYIKDDDMDPCWMISDHLLLIC